MLKADKVILEGGTDRLAAALSYCVLANGDLTCSKRGLIRSFLKYSNPTFE